MSSQWVDEIWSGPWTMSWMVTHRVPERDFLVTAYMEAYQAIDG